MAQLLRNFTCILEVSTGLLVTNDKFRPTQIVLLSLEQKELSGAVRAHERIESSWNVDGGDKLLNHEKEDISRQC